MLTDSRRLRPKAAGPIRAEQCVTCEQVELVVELQQLEGASCPPALLFSQAVVNVPLVFGRATHPELCLLCQTATTKRGFFVNISKYNFYFL